MMRRYARASLLTGARLASQLPALAADGYWIDDDRFFFVAEEVEPSSGRLVAVPSIADRRTRRAAEVISLERLAALLRGHSQTLTDIDTLAATFDMPDRETLAVSVGGWNHLIDPARQGVLETSRASLDGPALYSPDGRYACFLRDHDLWLKERWTGAERPLTTDGVPNYGYGRQPEASPPAVTYRQSPYPVGLWSPDSQWLLTHRVDERSLPDLALIQHAPAGEGRPVLHRFKYAMPGDPLPTITYVAIHVASGRVIPFDEFSVPLIVTSPFLQRMAWFSGTHQAWYVRLDRYRQQAELICLDLVRGIGRIAVREVARSGYLDLHPIIMGTPNVRTLATTNEVIWYSERDGRGHLYLYDATTGGLRNRITAGEWDVRDIVHVDEARRTVLFLAGGMDPEADPARRSLCAINLDGSGFEVLRRHDGDISLPKSEPAGLAQDRPFRPSYARTGVSPDGRSCIVRYTSVQDGNWVEIIDLQEPQAFVVASLRPDEDSVKPRHFTALAADGVVRLHGTLFLPPDFDERRRYPLIDYLYPGPQMLWQPQAFRALRSTQALVLAELGFITIMCETRGMPVGTRAFHQAGYPQLLEPQLADHAAVVRQLCARHAFIDGNRIGVLGYSGGGAAAARALFDYGDVFKVGVAVCGNHDSSFYLASWSDKYRGEGDPARWSSQANGTVAHKLRGKLLLISGDMDENVHVSQTLALADALIRANKDFDLLIVPNAGHAVLATHGYAQRRVWDYFVRHLLGELPPADFALDFEPNEVARLSKLSLSELRQ